MAKIKRILYGRAEIRNSLSEHASSVYLHIDPNDKPDLFNLFFSGQTHDLLCYHSNIDLFIFSRRKISCSRATAHLVFN